MSYKEVNCVYCSVIHVLKGSGIINARFCDKTEGIKFRDDIERSELEKAFTSKKRFGQKILKVLSNHLLIQSHSVKVN